jgi:AbrB family looped-hinge helix DNA binding protein
MTRARLSTKGQFIIPREIRRRLGWRAGTVLEVEDRGDVVVVRAADDAPRTTLDDVRGFLRYDGPPLSVEEMDEAVARSLRGREGCR